MLTEYELSQWPQSLIKIKHALDTATFGEANARDVRVVLAHFETRTIASRGAEGEEGEGP